MTGPQPTDALCMLSRHELTHMKRLSTICSDITYLYRPNFNDFVTLWRTPASKW